MKIGSGSVGSASRARPASSRAASVSRRASAIVAIDARREDGKLGPDVGHLRILAKNLLEERDRLRPPPLAREIDGGAILLERLALVLGIGQRLGVLCGKIGLRSDIAERLQPL